MTKRLRNLRFRASSSEISASPMASDIISVIIQADPPSRLDKALARDVPEEARLSRSKIGRLIADGFVKLEDAAVTDAKARPVAGQVYAIAVPPPAEMHAAPEDIPLDIVHEDPDVIVINKPAGMVVHPAPGSPSGTLVNALLYHFGQGLSGTGGALRPGIVHRIDKDTSGLLVVAKSDEAHNALAAQFADHSVHRRYVALCHGVPDPGDPRLMGLRGIASEAGGIRITTELARHKHDRQKQAVTWAGGRRAVTHVQVVDRFADQVAQIACRLETGRTHQIRVHLSYAGHALIGDPVYGRHRAAKSSALGEAAGAVAGFSRQALHAAELGFVHPRTGKALSFKADLPSDMAVLLAVLRGSAG